MKAHRHILSDQANDIRGCAFSPSPDRRVRRALVQLLNEPREPRRREYAFIMVAVLVMAILLCGIVW